TNDGSGSLFSVHITDVLPSNAVAGSLVLNVGALPDTCTVNSQNVPCLRKTHSVSYSGSYKASSIGGKNHVDATAGSSPGGSSVSAKADWPVDLDGRPSQCPVSPIKGLVLTK